MTFTRVICALFVIIRIRITESQSYGAHVHMKDNTGAAATYATATKLTDNHGNVILEKNAKGDWYTVIDHQHNYVHDASAGSDYYWQKQRWGVPMAGTAKKDAEFKLLLSATNHYFMGFGKRDAAIPAAVDTYKSEPFGYDDSCFIFYPNRHHVEVLAASALSDDDWENEFKYIIAKYQVDAAAEHAAEVNGEEYPSLWSMPTASGQYEVYRHEAKYPKLWFAYTFSTNPEQQQKFELLMEKDTTTQRCKHALKPLTKQQDIPVKEVKHRRGFIMKWITKAPYKDSQYWIGNCVQLSVNNILGGEYWTNHQYYRENVAAYKDIGYKTRNIMHFNGVVHTYYEAFSTDSVSRALWKVGADQEQYSDLKLETLRKKNQWNDVLGIRVEYMFRKKGLPKWELFGGLHSVAFRRVVPGGSLGEDRVGDWWFIQSHFLEAPRKLASFDEVVRKIKSMENAIPYLVKLKPQSHGKLLRPKDVNRHATYKLDTEGKIVEAAPATKDEHKAQNEYANVLHDLQDDVEGVRSRRERREKALLRIQDGASRADVHRKQRQKANVHES